MVSCCLVVGGDGKSCRGACGLGVGAWSHMGANGGEEGRSELFCLVLLHVLRGLVVVLVVGVFGVVGGFCGCVMGVMGLWFVFGGGGGYCFRLSPGRGSGLAGRVFGRVCWVWVVVVALGGWFFLVGFWSQA